MSWMEPGHCCYSLEVLDRIRSVAVHEASQVTMSLRIAFLAIFPFFAFAEDTAPALRGSPNIDSIQQPTAAQLTCSGTGALPQAPACFGGNVLTNWYEIKVVSVDGNVGVVDLKAVGPLPASCPGAHFENSAGAITIENDETCGLSNYEYTVNYCSDQDKLIIDIIKPYGVKVVLPATECPDNGEV
ncbi:unnamed protein product [Cladocopium goreaui]|uniref:Mitochondrial coenzyme A transporter SLC25A42 n=1 Tax=Cladocopium goreaui TaxID=2562237 RepID=A0A9P1DUJ9_9DINO|nr:unnamed protein product [Cladocopium goreaui]